MARKRLQQIRIDWRRQGDAWGRAFNEEWRIVLDPRLNAKKLLEIATHETVHVVLPVLDEAAVETLGRQVADVLTRLGFRRTEDADE